MKAHIHKKNCRRMFTEALLITAQTENNPHADLRGTDKYEIHLNSKKERIAIMQQHRGISKKLH